MTGAASAGDELVHALIAAQCPEYDGLELGRWYHHHEHTSVRIGEKFGLMMPNEAWQSPVFAAAPALLAQVAPHWTFPASVPVFLGEPSDDFPFYWHIVSWHESATAANVPLDDDGGVKFATALEEVHTPAPTGTPLGRHSAVPLSALVDEWESLIDAVSTMTGPDGQRIDPDVLDPLFRAAVDQPVDTPLSWTHSNLSPLSVLTDRGAFTGICDWWSIGAGDPAADLGAATLVMTHSSLEQLPLSYRRLTQPLLERSRGYRLLYMLRFIATENPFFTRYGWDRLEDVRAPARAGRARRR